jgi:hypothetical protein
MPLIWRVQRPVVGGAVDPPQLGVGKVGQLRPVVEAQELEEPEGDVGVRAGVGDDDLRAAAALAPVEQVDQVHRVAWDTGEHHAGGADGLVVDHVEPGRAAPLAEVFVRPGVHRADRHHEPHPVGRGHEAAAPRPGQADAVLRVDQHRVRCA